MTPEKDKKNSNLAVMSTKGKKKQPAKQAASRPPAAKSGSKPSGKQAPPTPAAPSWLTRVTLLLVLALVTVIFTMPFPHQYELDLQVGDIAPQDIKADRDRNILDKQATREKIQASERNSPLVFKLNDQAAAEAADRVHSLFERGRAILNAPQVAAPVFEDPEIVDRPSAIELAALKNRFQAAFNLESTDDVFKTMTEIRFSRQAERAIAQLIGGLLRQGVVAEKQTFSEGRAALVKHEQLSREDKISDPSIFLSLEEAQRKVKDLSADYRDDFTPKQLEAVVTLARRLLYPNLVFDQTQTDQLRVRNASNVAEVYIQVKRGEMIVREGEKVDEDDITILEQLSPEMWRDWLPRAGGVFLLSLVFLGVTAIMGDSVFRRLKMKDKSLLFLSVLFLINLILAHAALQVGQAMETSPDLILYLAPLAGGPMLASIFLGPLPGIFFAVVSSGLSAMVYGGQLSMFIYLFLGAITGLAGVVRVRERSQVTKSGLMVGLVNAVVIFGVSLLENGGVGAQSFFNMGAGFLSGMLAGIVVTGLTPSFEMAFGYTTDVKLLELANLDKPILRELMVQAPGTYHHSVIVGAMVEAAAEAIGANPLLAKVAAYYHDLGKMKKPLYFVENQLACENKHEKLAPSMSALILISHVKDGVELARKNKLSQDIIDIIKQHHGTSLIAFFYQKAKNSRTEDQPEINIENYRYPGPKPQTREAGLVMLADAVEAASRTLGEPTPARVQGMVQKIINNIFSDGQLDECELTLKDLHSIARSFNKILTGIFHRRISYPEPASKDRTSAHGSSPKQPPKEPADKQKPANGERKEDLKRLGIS
jgi:hypothetical protein